MKDKLTKWEIKVFLLFDSTNGYVHRLQVYTGKNSDLSTSEKGLDRPVGRVRSWGVLIEYSIRRDGCAKHA